MRWRAKGFLGRSKDGNGNGKRVLDALLEIMPSERPPIREAEIFESYARSIERQQVGLLASRPY